jgi:cobalt/nickel transport system permease protein
LVAANVHIPDGFLSGGVAAGTWVASGCAIAAALRAERREPSPMPAGILGSVAAFLFAAQMINVPVAAGTSGHLVGATLAAVLLGPWRGLIAIASVLAVQALLFQDGGVLAYGANLADMGVCGCFVGYAVARLVGRGIPGPRGVAAGAVTGAFAATVCGATGVSVWLSWSGLYPLDGILPVMLVSHVAIGLLEAALTGAILVTLLRFRPDLVAAVDDTGTAPRPFVSALGLLIVAAAVAAFVAPFASTLPDGLQKSAETLGFASRARAVVPGVWPGYRLPWPRLAAIAPAVTGVIGVAAAATLAFAISRSLSTGSGDAHR